MGRRENRFIEHEENRITPGKIVRSDSFIAPEFSSRLYIQPSANSRAPDRRVSLVRYRVLRVRYKSREEAAWTVGEKDGPINVRHFTTSTFWLYRVSAEMTTRFQLAASFALGQCFWNFFRPRAASLVLSNYSNSPVTYRRCSILIFPRSSLIIFRIASPQRHIMCYGGCDYSLAF